MTTLNNPIRLYIALLFARKSSVFACALIAPKFRIACLRSIFAYYPVSASAGWSALIACNATNHVVECL